jgi:small subunit ribosomal protein S15
LARLHSKKHGRSRSRFPKRKVAPDWQPLSSDEVKELVRKFARQGYLPSEIGRILRDHYGVPSVRAAIGKRLVAFLEEEKLAPKVPEDLLQLLRKAVRMWNHLKNHKKDIHNRVKYQHLLSKIHRLSKYYKRVGKLPQDWKYTPESAALLVR